jgi:hypothetical protein
VNPALRPRNGGEVHDHAGDEESDAPPHHAFIQERERR